MNLGELAELVGGQLRGDPSITVEGVSSPQNPRGGTVVFCQSEGDVELALKGKPSALVVKSPVEGVDCIVVEDVRLALAIFLERFYKEKHPSGISERAVVGEGSTVGQDVYIGDFCVIGRNVRIGDGVKIYPFTYVGDNSFIDEGTVIFSHVAIYPGSVIGKRVRIHSGAVIGADGFGYHITPRGIKKLNHIGNVVIEDDVEIGASTTVDRALIDSTRIRMGTKVDNLVMIAHNCDVGVGNIIVGQTGLSGSVKTGRGVILAGQVAVRDHVKIGDEVIVTGKAGVSKDLEAGKVYGAAIPAMEWNKWKRINAILMRLPELIKRLR